MGTGNVKSRRVAGTVVQWPSNKCKTRLRTPGISDEFLLFIVVLKALSRAFMTALPCKLWYYSNTCDLVMAAGNTGQQRTFSRDNILGTLHEGNFSADLEYVFCFFVARIVIEMV